MQRSRFERRANIFAHSKNRSLKYSDISFSDKSLYEFIKMTHKQFSFFQKSHRVITIRIVDFGVYLAGNKNIESHIFCLFFR